MVYALYKKNQYNANLEPTRVQLQNMSIGSTEGFKKYAQILRDLAGRVQPPLSDQELVDMLMGSQTGPFFNLLIGSSSPGLNELILTGERVESGIKSGKISMHTSYNIVKNPFGGKREANDVYKSCSKSDRHQSVGAVLTSNLALIQQQ